MRNLFKIIILGAVAAVLAGAGSVLAQTTVDATAGWSPPTYGTPVEHYVLEHSLNDGPWAFVGTTTDTTYTLNISYTDYHRVRVAGVDAQGRQGPFSLPSNAYNPSVGLDAPTQPGQPTLF